MTIKHLNQIELSRRWGISPRTLERWRWRRTGPPFLKLGGHVAYQLCDIEAFEAGQRQVLDPNQPPTKLSAPIRRDTR